MFLDTKTRIANRHGRNDATTRTRIGEIYNDILQEAYNIAGVTDEETHSIITVANRMAYPLEPNINPVQELMVIPTNNRRVRWVPRDEFEAIPEHTNSGVPYRYTVIDRCGVMAQPESQITFVSDNVGDTTQTIVLRGISNYRYVEETITLNGTTDVVSTNYYTRLVKTPTLSATALGTVTIDSNAAGVTIASITTGNLTATTPFQNPGDTIDISGGTAAEDVTVEGTIVDATNNIRDVYHRETVTLSSGTGSTTSRFTTIRNISTETVSTTAIVAKADDNEPQNDVIAVIPPGAYSSDYQIVAFDPYPDAEMEILYKGHRNPPPLVNDGDRPAALMDTRTWPVIERWAEAAFNEWKGDRRGVSFIFGQKAFQDDMAEIKRVVSGSVRNRITKGQNSYNISAKKTHTFHLDPNVYGPAER